MGIRHIPAATDTIAIGHNKCLLVELAFTKEPEHHAEMKREKKWRTVIGSFQLNAQLRKVKSGLILTHVKVHHQSHSHSCCFGAGLVHANTQNNIQDTHLETSRRFGMSVSSLTHSLAHPTYSALFHLLTLSLSLFYKGRYTNNPHMFSSFLTYSCLLEDEHISLCLFLSISFTHIHARHTQ